MVRAVALVVVMAVSAAAQPVTHPSQVAKKQPVAKPGSHPKIANSKTKPKVTRRSKHHAKKATANKHVAIARAKTPARSHVVPAGPKRITVEQQSIALQSVGRVRYADNMPPGFAWPPTDEMIGVEHSCEAELDALDVKWKHAEALGKVTDPIVVPSMVIGGIPFHSAWDKGPFVLDCELVGVLARVAPKLSALGVREVTFGSIYRNTLVRFGGVTKNVLSRHALGLAMDIKSFTDQDGRKVDVEIDYPKHDRLLLAIEELIDHSKDFRILLTPKNDPISHSNHFHLEASVDFRSH